MANNNKLIIVESPTKARTISNIIPNNVKVVASMGHVRDLPKNRMGINLDNFEPKYVVSPDKKNLIKELKNDLETVDELYLATDEDREGESISWHLLELLKPKENVVVKRMVFHEITESSILKAFENTRDINMKMVNAQEARRIVDRLYGYNISPVLWSKLSNKKLSAGRVQSPGLRLVVNREIERLKFKPSVYFKINAVLETKGITYLAWLDEFDNCKIVNGVKFFNEITGELKKDDINVLLLNDSNISEIKLDLESATWLIVDKIQKEIISHPYMPFITSTLQQEANIRLGLSADSTMRIAQKLYENGFITYMRTDSPHLSNEGLNVIQNIVKKEYGEDVLQLRNFESKSDLAQNAHECIRPAIIDNTFKTAGELGLAGREAGLYTLIYKRTIASQMKDAIKLQTKVFINANCQNGKVGKFISSGIQIKYAGFLMVYEEVKEEGREDEEAEQRLPEINIGDSVNLNELKAVEKTTKPKARYNQATLVKKLEELGIGRPSTYATIISSLIKKEYIVEQSKQLIPTFLGVMISQFMEKNFTKYIDYKFTAGMEEKLDDIAEGNLDCKDFLSNFYCDEDSGLKKDIETKIKEIIPSEVKKIILPQIDEPILYGRYGAYIKRGEESIGLPKKWLPENVNEDTIADLIENGSKHQEKSLAQEIGFDDRNNKKVYFCPEGRYGAYWMESDDDKKDTKFIGVPKGTKAEDWSIEDVITLFNLPLVIGQDENGADIFVNIGKYGPYVGCNREFRAIPKGENFLHISIDRAKELLATEKTSFKKKKYSKVK